MNFEVLQFKLAEQDIAAITEKFDCGWHVFTAPEENPYNLFA